jgi:CRP-like cAMP-binding protein
MVTDPDGQQVLGSLLPELPDNELQIIAKSAESIVFRTRSLLVEQGSKPDRVFLIMSGIISVFRRGKGKRSILVGRAGPGEIVGDLGFILKAPHSVDARADVGGTAVVWRAEAFESILNRCPVLTRLLLRRFAKIVLHADEQRQALIENDVPTRVIGYLLDRSVVLPDGRCVVAPKPKNTDVARSLGVSREAVARAMSLLACTNEVVISRGEIALRRAP